MKNKEQGTFSIIRFFFDKNRPCKIMATGYTWKQAQKHCNDPATSKPYKWFDGFMQTS